MEPGEASVGDEHHGLPPPLAALSRPLSAHQRTNFLAAAASVPARSVAQDARLARVPGSPQHVPPSPHATGASIKLKNELSADFGTYLRQYGERFKSPMTTKGARCPMHRQVVKLLGLERRARASERARGMFECVDLRVVGRCPTRRGPARAGVKIREAPSSDDAGDCCGASHPARKPPTHLGAGGSGREIERRPVPLPYTRVHRRRGVRGGVRRARRLCAAELAPDVQHEDGRDEEQTQHQHRDGANLEARRVLGVEPPLREIEGGAGGGRKTTVSVTVALQLRTAVAQAHKRGEGAALSSGAKSKQRGLAVYLPAGTGGAAAARAVRRLLARRAAECGGRRAAAKRVQRGRAGVVVG